jgi:hypothetical protein
MSLIEQIARNSKSESFRRRNPQLYGKTSDSDLRAMETDQPKPTSPQALAGRTPKYKRRKTGVAIVVSLTVHCHRELDSDNLQGACKPLRDAIASTLRLDDGDPCLRWEYTQIQTRGSEGVVVKIENLQQNSSKVA